MREIKFRAKRLDGLGWAYGYFIKTPITAEFSCDGQYFDSGGQGRYCIIQDGVAHEIDVTTLGQYTGLKDSKGVEIFKGDIVSLDEFVALTATVVGQVKYDEGCYFIDRTSYPLNKWSDKIKIIGNIYENPELLK